MQVARVLAIAACSFIAACKVLPPNAIFACESSSECPPTQRCVEGLCLRATPNQMPDASSAERDPSAMPPAAASKDASTGAIDAGEASDAERPRAEPQPPKDSAEPITPSDPMTPNDAGAMFPATAGGGAAMAGSGAPPASTPSDCSCTTTGACCDGCKPRNEGGACDDEAPACATGVCRSGACELTPEGDFCLVAGSCLPDGMVRTGNRCLACDVAKNPTDWTRKPEGASCDDGRFCNGPDTCHGTSDLGSCYNAGNPCVTRDDTCIICDEDADRCVPDPKFNGYDASTNLSWTNAFASDFTWEEAVTQCNRLNWCGSDAWRLPTITELRTTLAGCASTETGGTCAVDDSCTESSCAADCGGCALDGGPNQRQYLKSTLRPLNGDYAWSATTVSNGTTATWALSATTGAIVERSKTSVGTALCVRVGR